MGPNSGNRHFRSREAKPSASGRTFNNSMALETVAVSTVFRNAISSRSGVAMASQIGTGTSDREKRNLRQRGEPLTIRWHWRPWPYRRSSEMRSVPALEWPWLLRSEQALQIERSETFGIGANL